MRAVQGDWPALVERATGISPFAVELSALSEPELPGLEAFLAARPPLPFRFLAVHGPSKGRTLDDDDLSRRLDRLPTAIDAVVLHPDQLTSPAVYARLGAVLALENMDDRKSGGRTVEELEPLFRDLPLARFCFDIAHAASVDPQMEEAHALLDRFGPCLSHVHLSSLGRDGSHVPLTREDEECFAPVLRRCRDVPWILEAAPR